MSVGTHFRAPLSVRVGSGPSTTIVQIVDANGVITGAPGSSGAISVDTLVATNKKLEFRATSQYINSPSAGKIAIITTPAAADDIQLTGGVNVTGTLAVSGAVALASTLSALSVTVTGKITATVGLQARAVAVTATADGLTTGIIPDDAGDVTVTSSVNTKFVTLPTPTPGVVVQINAEATGYKLRSSTPASVAINGGTGASASSAVSAKLLVCRCSSATAWIVTAFAADGTVTAQAPAA